MNEKIDNLNADELIFLDSWEEVYKKGILTFWALYHLSQRAHDASSLFDVLHGDQIELNDHSLYRMLRRFYDVGLINHDSSAGKNKYYKISDKGRRVLTAFMERNIAPLNNALRAKGNL